MSLNTITSANANGVLVVATVFPSGIVLENFGSDQALTQDEETLGNATMGVDGKLSVSYKPSPKNVTLTFSAAADACESLDTVKRTIEANKTQYECTLVFTLPDISKVYTYRGGVMIGAQGIPNVKAELEQMNYKFVFETLSVSSI